MRPSWFTTRPRLDPDGALNGATTRRLTPDFGGHLPPLMFHYAVNRPIGATRRRGRPDAILGALRYSNCSATARPPCAPASNADVSLSDDTKVQNDAANWR
jgi:hypothetical protein